MAALLPPLLLHFLLFIGLIHALAAEKPSPASSSSSSSSSSDSSSSDSASPFSFSFSSFDPAICQTSLLLHGDVHLISHGSAGASSSSSSSIRIGGSSPNSSGSLFFSHPISMSASTSFSSSFSFSFSFAPADDLRGRDPNPSYVDASRSNFSFVVVASPSPPAASDQVWILGSLELDSLLADLHMSDAQSSDETLKALGQRSRDGLQAWVEYNGPEKMVEIRLSEPAVPSSSSASPPILSSHTSVEFLSQHSPVYVGFMAETSAKDRYHVIHTWMFSTYDSSQHSMPFNPNQDRDQGRHHHHTLLTLENAYTRACTMILSVLLFSSVSAIALWAMVERALRKSRREVAMLPILCDYEKVQTRTEDKEEAVKEQQKCQAVG